MTSDCHTVSSSEGTRLVMSGRARLPSSQYLQATTLHHELHRAQESA